MNHPKAVASRGNSKNRAAKSDKGDSSPRVRQRQSSRGNIMKPPLRSDDCGLWLIRQRQKLGEFNSNKTTGAEFYQLVPASCQALMTGNDGDKNSRKTAKANFIETRQRRNNKDDLRSKRLCEPTTASSGRRTRTKITKIRSREKTRDK